MEMVTLLLIGALNDCFIARMALARKNCILGGGLVWADCGMRGCLGVGEGGMMS